MSTTAFVFAGGGSLGAVQVGMLKGLLGRGIAPDWVVGSSVGALNAAFYAGDPTAAGVARLEAIWRRLRRADVFPVPVFGGLRNFLSGRGHLVDPSGLATLIEKHLPFRDLEQARLRCYIVATDLLQGTEVRISSGPALRALLASTAIPGVFPPVAIDGRWFIDGGVATPISPAVDLGARRIYVLPTGYSCTLPHPPRSAISALLHGLNILMARQLTAAVRQFGSEAEIIVVPPLCPLNVSPFDFHRVGELIDQAAAHTERWLDKGEQMVDGVPHQLPPHRHGDKSGNPYGAQWM